MTLKKAIRLLEEEYELAKKAGVDIEAACLCFVQGLETGKRDERTVIGDEDLQN